MSTTSTIAKIKPNNLRQLKPKINEKVELVEETKKISLDQGNLDKQVIISAHLNAATKCDLIRFLKETMTSSRGKQKTFTMWTIPHERWQDVVLNHPRSCKSFARCWRKELKWLNLKPSYC